MGPIKNLLSPINPHKTTLQNLSKYTERIFSFFSILGDISLNMLSECLTEKSDFRSYFQLEVEIQKSPVRGKLYGWELVLAKISAKLVHNFGL